MYALKFLFAQFFTKVFFLPMTKQLFLALKNSRTFNVFLLEDVVTSEYLCIFPVKSLLIFENDIINFVFIE